MGPGNVEEKEASSPTTWPSTAPTIAELQALLVRRITGTPIPAAVLAPVVEDTLFVLGRAELGALRRVAGLDDSGSGDAGDDAVLADAAARVLLARFHLEFAELPCNAVNEDALAALLAELDAGLRAMTPLVDRVLRQAPELLRSFSQVSRLLQQHRTSLENAARRLRGEPERTIPGTMLIDDPRPSGSIAIGRIQRGSVGRTVIHDAPPPVRRKPRERVALVVLGAVAAAALFVHLVALDSFGLFAPERSTPTSVPGVVRIERRAYGTRVVVDAAFAPNDASVAALSLAAQPTTFVDQQGFPVATVVNGRLMKIPHPMGDAARSTP